MNIPEIAMAQRYIASLCIHYFDDLYTQISESKQNFIISEWYEVVYIENELRPCISVGMFMEKYSLRLKLVRP